MAFDMKSATQDRHDGQESDSPFLGSAPEPIEDPRPEHAVERTEKHTYRTGRILAHWESEGHDSPFLESKNLMIGVVFALIVIVAYSIFTDSPIMAITFILIGMTGYLLFSRPGEPTEYRITETGVSVGREFYDYQSVTSFWIIEGHPHFPKHLILDIAGIITPRLHIPLDGNDAEIMRRVLLKYVPEEEYEPNLIDIIERILHI